jgi:hypothetical protein
MMSNLREDLWSVWHLPANEASVLQRLDMITRVEKKRKSAAARVCNYRGDDPEVRAQNSKMLQHWSRELDNCAYELLGIANGLIGREMP